MAEKYIVLIGDIVDSKLNKLNINEVIDTLNELNIRYALTEFQYYAGDEIQVLFSINSKMTQIIRHIRHKLLPYKLRIGIGVGTIDDYNQAETNSYKMNGDAFFKARKAITKLAHNKSHSSILRTGNEDFDLSINTIMLMYNEILNSWSDKQWEAIMLYEKYSTYRQVSEELGVSINAVRKRLISSDWDIIKTVENNITDLFRMNLENL